MLTKTQKDAIRGMLADKQSVTASLRLLLNFTYRFTPSKTFVGVRQLTPQTCR